MKRPFVALLAVVGVAGLLLMGLFAARLSARLGGEAGSTATPTSRVMLPWAWVEPGFSGADAITLTQGITQFLHYDWSPNCDAPGRRHIPMLWGMSDFYTDSVELATLFNGPCNDGRPLFFLNEPARVEQGNVSPTEAAHMFYALTRAPDWPYERWHGPIYGGNNLIEERAWDAEFVREFARLYNDGSAAIPEIAGWAIHLYGNYEYGPDMGDPNKPWTGDIPAEEIEGVVERTMATVDAHLAERRAEGNATSLVVTEFGLLQASQWHTPRTYYYTTTASFMDAYVRRFDLRPEIQAWFWYKSIGPQDQFLDTDLMIDAGGALTPNGVKWRELAAARQGGERP